SGKTQAFGACIRGFESYRPCHCCQGLVVDFLPFLNRQYTNAAFITLVLFGLYGIIFNDVRYL
ncbi:hypothetical protein KAI46_05460, partial [bacterium]|nr:hypothetical protein [bacterium]